MVTPSRRPPDDGLGRLWATTPYFACVRLVCVPDWLSVCPQEAANTIESSARENRCLRLAVVASEGSISRVDDCCRALYLTFH